MSNLDPVITIEQSLLEELADAKLTTQKNKIVLKKLFYVLILATVFTGIKIAGGVISHSITIIADAAHMFTDFFALLVAILSIWVSGFKATKAHSYGYHRAGVIGAMASVVVLWVLNGFLVYYGIERIMHIDEIVVKGNIMFWIACFGFVVNLIMVSILYYTNTHGLLPRRNRRAKLREAGKQEEHCHVEESFHNGEEQGIIHSEINTGKYKQMSSQDTNEHEGPSNDQNVYTKRHIDSVPLEATLNPYDNQVRKRVITDGDNSKKNGIAKKIKNLAMTTDRDHLNIRATLLHLLGDILQSFTVIIVSALIWIFPEDMKIADPIATLIFAVIIFITSVRILRECLFVLMEATPDGLCLEEFKNELLEIEGVDEIHDLHVWTLSVGKHSMSAHIYSSQNEGTVLKRVTAMCRLHGIYHTTVQIETVRDKENEDYVDCKHDLH